MKKAPSSPLLRTLDAFLEGRTGGWFINIIVIPSLFVFALVLPPLALPQRLMSAGYTSVDVQGASVEAKDGTLLSIPEGATRGGTSIKLTMLDRDAFMKSSSAQALPAVLDVKSALYQPSVQGQAPSLAVLTIPIPDAADPWTTLDVYGYNGKKWSKLPFQMYANAPERENQVIDTYLMGQIPEGVIVAQTQTQTPAISADISAKGGLPPQARDVLAEVNPLGLTIADGGGVAGNVPSVAEVGPSSSYEVLPTISNVVADQLRSDLTDDMITIPETRQQHVQTLVDLAVEKLYPGINIDYQGITPNNKNDFTAFVQELAQALHAKDKILSVTLAMPTPKSADTWDTGPFDWAAIGQAADIVRMPLPVNSQAYQGDPPLVNTYLQWAVGQIDRYKIEVALSLSGRDEFGSSYAPITFSTALQLVGPLDISDKVEPGDKVTFDLPKLKDSGLKYDAVTGLYSFSYKDGKGQNHTVSLENVDSLSRKMALALEYNLRGVALRDVIADGVDTHTWEALKQYRQTQSPNYKANLEVVWRVDGKTVGQSSLSDPEYTWTAPSKAGNAQVEAVFSFDDGQSTAGTTGIKTVEVAAVLPTPKPTTAPRVTAPTVKPTAAPPKPPVASAARRVPFGYGIQVNGGDPAGEAADIKSLGFDWVKIQVPWQDFESSKGVANLSSIDNFVNVMSGNGIKVLLSIVKAPAWSRQQNGIISAGNGPPDNMKDAADFMGGVAGIYCGKVQAIEVWNEENLDVEWHDKRGVSAALYMDMLKQAYTNIKQKCPGMIVVSGAMTPTGGGGATAIDDLEYLRQLYANGLKQYSDAIGAHPSGFRSSPECKLSIPGCAGPYADHRSFFFLDTMESYHAVMAQNGDSNKQIFATEFGWPVGTGGGAHPAGQYNDANTVAGYYQRAYQWAKGQSWVGALFAWQLDFSGGEVGAFRIKGSPTENALRSMPK